MTWQGNSEKMAGLKDPVWGEVLTSDLILKGYQQMDLRNTDIDSFVSTCSKR